ncbi:MAG TPA: hypothetical protein VF395_13525 [Polyangiaceae bacterium]
MTGEVRLEKSIRASREDIFRACATTDGLERWYADRVTGGVAEGSSVRLEWPDLNAGVELRVADLVQNERIVLASGDSRVTLTISEGHVALVHEGLAVTDDLPGFDSSWRVALAVLAHAVEAHPGRPRRTHWVARPARTSANLAHLYFTEPEALTSWLGRAEKIGREGESYSLRLESGETMRGTVIARPSGRDVAFTWEERGNSALVFRTLPSPSEGERVLAVCWSHWTPEQTGERAVVTGIERAIERLSSVLLQSGEA